MSRPITPKEARLGLAIHPAVFNAVNSFLSRGQTTIKTCELLAVLEASGLERAAIFKSQYLNFEDAYRSVGWDVEYDKPGYNETYDAFWVFTARSDR